MIYRFVAMFSLLFALAGCAANDNIDQPLRRAKIGDYAVFQGKSHLGDTMRQEVTAIAGPNVTIKTTSSKDGTETDVAEHTFHRDKICNLVSQAISRGEKIVDAGEGEEALKVNGRNYQCKYRWYSFNVNESDKADVAQTKVWISVEAPVYGMVKSETKARGNVIHMMELTESSSK